MRALIFGGLALVAAIGGYLLYRQSASTAPEGGMFAEAPAAARATAEDCNITNALYEYNEDPRLQLRFESTVAPGEIEVLDERQRTPGNVNLIVRATSFQTDYTFTPDNAFMQSGPKYQTLAIYFRPASGGERLRVSLFDSTMHAMHQMPRYDSAAPGYIYIPELMRVLYPDHIDLPPGAFRFHSCEAPAAAAP